MFRRRVVVAIGVFAGQQQVRAGQQRDAADAQRDQAEILDGLSTNPIDKKS